jgi:asparagine synthase (glutamine-hydrolysing)
LLTTRAVKGGFMEDTEFLNRPYSYKNGSTTYDSLANLCNNEEFNHFIDSESVASLLMKNYLFFEKTLLKDVGKKIVSLNNYSNNSINEVFKIPYNTIDADTLNVAQKLYNMLREECLSFINNKEKVGLLLSGGMDSRIIAGILKNLEQTGAYSGSIICLNWGIENSRDVIYAKRIADCFKWDYIHFEVESEQIISNIELTGKMGAEYSPIHLHAIPLIAELKGIDCILGGSYGDSVGRGCYSGKHIKNSTNILNDNHYIFYFLKDRIFKQSKKSIAHRLNRFAIDNNLSKLHCREIELQTHYLRRQLNACMDLINKRIPFYQMFTSLEIYEYMFSLKHQCRTDDVYIKVMKYLPSILSSLPWSHTGLPFPHRSGTEHDNYFQDHNRYGYQLRHECRSVILEHINDGSLQKLEIFNNKNLDRIDSIWSRNLANKANLMDEKVAWLASLSCFIKEYNVKSNMKVESTLTDSMNTARFIINSKIYQKIKEINNA